MFVMQSKRVRQFVGRCVRGEDVHEALRAMAEAEGIHSGWVQAVGAFERVELAEYDQADQEYMAARVIETPTEVLTLSGNISSMNDQVFVHLHATVSRESDNGIQVFGGHVERATVFALEVRVVAYDDVALVRELDRATGLHLWVDASGDSQERDSDVARSAPRATRPVETSSRRSGSSRRSAPEVEPDESSSRTSAAASVGAGVTWAMAAAASAEAEASPAPATRSSRPRPVRPSENRVPAHRPPPIDAPPGAKVSPTVDDAGSEYDDEPNPEVGEFLDHRQFGVCRIERIDDEGGVLLKLTSGRRKLIKLDVMEVLEPRIEGERIIYPIRPRRPRHKGE